MTEWTCENLREVRREGDDLGGAMRLGAYQTLLTPGSKIAGIYDGAAPPSAGLFTQAMSALGARGAADTGGVTSPAHDAWRPRQTMPGAPRGQIA